MRWTIRRTGIANHTRTLLSNEAFVNTMVNTGAKLAMPSSLPGFLCLFAVLLRFVHFGALRFVASRAIATQKMAVLDGEKNK